MSATVEQIKRDRLVVIYRGFSAQECLEASQALLDAGVTLFEVTLNSESPFEAIELLAKRLGDRAAVGAGTVLNAQGVEDSAAAGATFIISPNTDEAVIRHSKERGLTSIPGAFTPSEIVAGRQAGADMVKVFPINVLGSQFLIQVRGPLDDVDLLPTGKVDSPEFVRELFAAGAAAVGVGAHLFGRDLFASRDWKALKIRAEEFLRAAGEGK